MSSQDILDQAPTPQSRPYAGFWLRVAAYIIDSFALQFILGLPFFLILVLAVGYTGLEDPSSADQTVIIQISLVGGILLFILQWLYFAIMESSKYQATLGKMAVSIKVTDEHYQQVSFGKATGRYFGKIVSSLIMGIGYLMVAFTSKKQGLHDMMASTLVVRKN